MSAAAHEIAPAKLNLALHVRGKRRDGRHDIETLFAFCTDGDRLSAEPAHDLSLSITGPFGAELSDSDNLVLQAARALGAVANTSAVARITLDKRLPVASGIGGGSADAAAALRLLTSLWKVDPSCAVEIAPKLGSDVPACLLSQNGRVRFRQSPAQSAPGETAVEPPRPTHNGRNLRRLPSRPTQLSAGTSGSLSSAYQVVHR